MKEERTFSSLIDAVMQRTLRRDRQSEIVSYARLTIRECQVRALFDQDLVETSIVTTAAPHIWTVPYTFRAMLAIEYPPQSEVYEPVFPRNLGPASRKRQSEAYYYYRASNYYVFSGLETGSTVLLSYYSYFPSYIYLEPADRKAQFDAEIQAWVYDATLTTEAAQEAERDKVTNWMIFNWWDMLLTGTLAKIFNAVSDERQRTTYAMYKSQQRDLLAGEAHVELQL